MVVTYRLGTPTGQAKSLLRSGVAWVLLWTSAIRGIASIGGFLLVMILGRMYGAVRVAAYALTQSVIMAIAVISHWGMNGTFIIHPVRIYDGST